MSEQFSIGDLAKTFGVTTRTIRFYEDQGLLAPRRNGHSRIYGTRDRVRLKLILRGKRLGLTLEESRGIIDMYHPGENNTEQLNTLLEKIRERKRYLQQQLRDIEVMMQDLQDAEDRCQEALTTANTTKESV